MGLSDKNNNETAEEEDQYKQSYKDADILQADGPIKEINDHVIDRIPREDMDILGLLGAE